MNPKPDGTITFGDGGVVTVRRRGRTDPTFALVLGKERIGGMDHVYLDRMIHRPGENELGGWALEGAISTILRRPSD